MWGGCYELVLWTVSISGICHRVIARRLILRMRKRENQEHKRKGASEMENWNCTTCGTQFKESVKKLERLGGLKGIAISHPHYYSSMVDCTEQFNVPVYLHEADRQCVMRPSERITFWSGETLSLQDDVTLIRLGGHFAGGTVLHWASGAESQGLLLSGDIIQVVADRRWVSFMYSYPNLIPLPAAEVARMRDVVARYNFERLYGAWFATIVGRDAKNAVLRSAD